MLIERLFAEHPGLVDNRVRPTGLINKFAGDNRWLVIHDEPDDLDMKVCDLDAMPRSYRHTGLETAFRKQTAEGLQERGRRE